MSRPTFRPTFHRDGTVTIWDVFAQNWARARGFSDAQLASLSPAFRERVIRHCEGSASLPASLGGDMLP